MPRAPKKNIGRPKIFWRTAGDYLAVCNLRYSVSDCDPSVVEKSDLNTNSRELVKALMRLIL